MAVLRLEVELNTANPRDLSVLSQLVELFGNGEAAALPAPVPERVSGEPEGTPDHVDFHSPVTTGQFLLLKILAEADRPLMRDEIARQMGRDNVGVGRAGGSLIRRGLVEPRVPGSSQWVITEWGRKALEHARVKEGGKKRDRSDGALRAETELTGTAE